MGEDFGRIESEVRFTFKPKTQLLSHITLFNRFNYHLAFIVKTTRPKLYHVNEKEGILNPGSTFVVEVTRHAQDVLPLPCVIEKEKVIIHYGYVPRHTSFDDIKPMFRSKHWKIHINEKKFKVVLGILKGTEIKKESVKEKETKNIKTSMLSRVKELMFRVNGNAKSESNLKVEKLIDRVRMCDELRWDESPYSKLEK